MQPCSTVAGHAARCSADAVLVESWGLASFGDRLGSERATVVLSLYFYGDEGPAAAGGEAAWQAWVAVRFG